MTTDILTSLRLRLASSESVKKLAAVALEQEATFLNAREELRPALYPEEDRTAYTDLIKEAESPAVLTKALNLAGKAHSSRADDETAKMRARVLLRRAFRPYVASVVALLKGAEDEVKKAVAEIERDEVRLFEKWKCPPHSTHLRIGAQQLAERLREAVAGLTAPNLQPGAPGLQPGKLTHWIKYAVGDADPGCA